MCLIASNYELLYFWVIINCLYINGLFVRDQRNRIICNKHFPFLFLFSKKFDYYWYYSDVVTTVHTSTFQIIQTCHPTPPHPTLTYKGNPLWVNIPQRNNGIFYCHIFEKKIKAIVFFQLFVYVIGNVCWTQIAELIRSMKMGLEI